MRVKPGAGKGEHQVVVIDHGLYVELPKELRLDYANFWLAMTPPQNSKILADICKKWGIADFQLYATITAFKQGGRSAEDMIMNEGPKRSKAELQALMKERIKKALNDTALFPRPLLFVGRCQNYIRATNWAHGNPIDRFAVMLQYANGAVVADANSAPPTLWDKVRNVYVSSLVHVVRAYLHWFSFSDGTPDSVPKHDDQSTTS